MYLNEEMYKSCSEFDCYREKKECHEEKNTLSSLMKNKVILSRMQVIEAQCVFHQNKWMRMFLSKCEIIDFSITFWVPT